jgi:phage gp37-like protein
MKFSVNWLREFVELSPSIDALAELLTMSGVEIEAIEKRGADFDHVVVAQIIESKPFVWLTMAAEQNARSFAARKTTKWTTKFRWRCRERN